MMPKTEAHATCILNLYSAEVLLYTCITGQPGSQWSLHVLTSKRDTQNGTITHSRDFWLLSWIDNHPRFKVFLPFFNFGFPSR